jgi:hypothetical protein
MRYPRRSALRSQGTAPSPCELGHEGVTPADAFVSIRAFHAGAWSPQRTRGEEPLRLIATESSFGPGFGIALFGDRILCRCLLLRHRSALSGSTREPLRASRRGAAAFLGRDLARGRHTDAKTTQRSIEEAEVFDRAAFGDVLPMLPPGLSGAPHRIGRELLGAIAAAATARNHISSQRRERDSNPRNPCELT